MTRLQVVHCELRELRERERMPAPQLSNGRDVDIQPGLGHIRLEKIQWGRSGTLNATRLTIVCFEWSLVTEQEEPGLLWTLKRTERSPHWVLGPAVELAGVGQSYVTTNTDILTTPTRTPHPENLHQRQAREVQSTSAKPVDFQATRSAKLQSRNWEGEEGRSWVLEIIDDAGFALVVVPSNIAVDKQAIWPCLESC
ncbi:hypothetical protein B0H14DRAFT_2561505 [Mycena olivaceomarginata]|nr:hypothetical protein B0H14DRAFT_2561505 [Mycena olivaceomarginata]